jgi:non-heme chloroperoxidase
MSDWTDPVGQESWIQRPDGTRLRVLTAGQGPTVVLAHGYGLTAIEWNLLWGLLLERGYRLVCFDQRGHGQSTIGTDGIGTSPMSADYLAVLEHVDARDAVLLGHSMGGFLAIAALLDVPGVMDRLGGLVLLATFSGSVTKGSMQNKTQIPMIRAGILQRMVANDRIGMSFARSIFGDDPDPAAMRAFLDVFREQNHRALLPILKAFAREDRADRLGQITLPTAVVCGRKDKTAPAWQSERLASSIPGARMTWLDGVGHAVNWEAPNSLVDAITEVYSS